MKLMSAAFAAWPEKPSPAASIATEAIDLIFFIVLPPDMEQKPHIPAHIFSLKGGCALDRPCVDDECLRGHETRVVGSKPERHPGDVRWQEMFLEALHLEIFRELAVID